VVNLVDVTYAQAYQVANRLNLTDVSGNPYDEENIDSIKNPTKTTIEEMIEEAEVDIEKECGRAWREITVSEYEYHEFTFRDYKKGRRTRYGRTEYVIKTNFDDIRSVTTLEILTNNDEWTDLIATGTAGSTPYDTTGDYFVQQPEGRIYLLKQLPIKGEDNIRIKYTYGRSVVPKDIRKACIMIAASQVIDYLPDMFIKAEGESGGISYMQLQNRWEKATKRILDRYDSQAFKPIYL
jgi:hypothetical protein